MPDFAGPGDLSSSGKYHLSPGMPFVRLILNDPGVQASPAERVVASFGGSTTKFSQLAPTDVMAVPNFLKHFVFTQPATKEWGEAQITLYDPSFDRLERLFIAGQNDVRFSWGWVNGPTSRTYRGVIYGYEPQFSHHGVTATVRICASAVRSQESVRTVAYPRRRFSTVSGIVRHVFSRYGLKLRIEPTQALPASSQTIYQSGIPDTTFVHDVLLPKALSAKSGRADYDFRVTDEEVVFAPADYGAPPIRTYEFARDLMGEALSFSPRFNGMLSLAQGGGRIIVGGYDPIERTSVTHTADMDKSKAWRPVLGPASQGDHVPADALSGRYFASPFADAAFVKAWGESRFDESKRSEYEATLSTIGDPVVEPDQQYNVRVHKNDGELHYTSGVWSSRFVTHEIQGGSYVTSMELIARGLRAGETRNLGVRPSSSGKKVGADGSSSKVRTSVPEGR